MAKNISDEVSIRILKSTLERNSSAQISVSGISMSPCLFESDIITVEKQSPYKVGDILVFVYKYGELLVHRLLKITNGKYYCKGDNSFRLEDIDELQIIGKITSIQRNNITMDVPAVNEDFINMSYQVNREFRKCGYDAEKTKESEVYKKYEAQYLRQKEFI